LPPLPATSTLQLVSFVQAHPTASGGERPQWWSPGVPRVPAITQFDGGPLGNANCVMASGAMLARLTFGILTTGSQLRSLQDDQEGGTSLPDLETAVGRGWGVEFSHGILSAVQLRALLFAGAGAEIVGLYGEIPLELRLQANFTAAHAIYLDGFREPGPEGPAAYYVIDPIGRPSRGYRGGWWPADIVERFALALGFGGIASAWGFAGGVVPEPHPILPPSAYPTAPSQSPSPGQSLSPSGSAPASPGTSPTPAPGEDPMPTGSTGSVPDQDEGTTPPSGPTVQQGSSDAGVADLIALYARCATQPPPGDCPPGLVAQVIAPPSQPSTGPPPVAPPRWPTDLSFVKLRYVTAVGPGTYQVIFDTPTDSTAGLWFWPSTSDRALSAAPVDLALLDGQTVGVATVVVDPAASFSFVATVSSGAGQAVSPVGSVVGP
ncbi:MAG TPA: hypothetical protein VIV06_10680, partial [Candidatus Limnocylindrales bacterium]